MMAAFLSRTRKSLSFFHGIAKIRMAHRLTYHGCQVVMSRLDSNTNVATEVAGRLD